MNIMREVDGKWILHTISNADLNQIGHNLINILKSSEHPMGISEKVTTMRGTHIKHSGGWKVFVNTSFGWVAVRNYDKKGRLISAAKYLPLLKAAGLPVELDSLSIKHDTTHLEKIA